MLHISLGVLNNGRGAEHVALIRCRIQLEGVALRPPDDATLDRSAAFQAAQETLDSWDKPDDDEDERFAMLRAVARTEFGRRGHEATTVRDIASAAGLSTGSVYRLIGSKDELLSSIMRSFTRSRCATVEQRARLALEHRREARCADVDQRGAPGANPL